MFRFIATLLDGAYFEGERDYAHLDHWVMINLYERYGSQVDELKPETHTYYFKNEDDAAMFKLVWG